MATVNIKRLLKFVLILLLTSLLAGCFSFRFWFERLDTLATWKLTQIFELSDEQQGILRPEVIDFRDWLRSETIPELSRELNMVKKLWDSGQRQHALTTFEQQSREVIDQTLIYSWPKVARLLTRLTPENAYAYQAWAEERMDDWYDETLSEAAKVEARTESLEEWFGHLSQPQRAMVARYTTLHPDERTIRINNGQQRRQRFLAMAMEGNWAQLEQAYKNPELLQSRPYQQWRANETEQLRTLLRALLPTLSPSQSQRISDTLGDWIARLHSVTNNPPKESS